MAKATIPEAIIFVGLQGAGKTTYFEKYFALTHAHISRDVQKTVECEMALFRKCLTSGESFAVDDTNGTATSRATLIRESKAAGFVVKAYFFDTPTRTAIGRNNHRKDKKPIPVPAILRAAKWLEPPSAQEGFDQITVVKPEPEERTPTRS